MKTPEEFYREFYPKVNVLSSIDKEIIILMSAYKKEVENNSELFVYIVEDVKGITMSYHRTYELAEQEIKRIQSNYKKTLVINCQKIY